MGRILIVAVVLAVFAFVAALAAFPSVRASFLHLIGAKLDPNERFIPQVGSTVSPARLPILAARAVSESARVAADGHVALPGAVTVAVSMADLDRFGDTTDRLARTIERVAVRRARARGTRMPEGLRVTVVADVNTLPGRPAVLGTSGWHVASSPQKTRLLSDAASPGKTKIVTTGRPGERVSLLFPGQRPVGGLGEIDLSSSSAVTIGRAGCDITFASEVVSRRHATLSYASGQWVLTDLGSTNGTFIENAAVKSAVLLHNDTVRIGRGGPELVFCRQSEASDAEVQR